MASEWDDVLYGMGLIPSEEEGQPAQAAGVPSAQSARNFLFGPLPDSGPATPLHSLATSIGPSGSTVANTFLATMGAPPAAKGFLGGASKALDEIEAALASLKQSAAAPPTQAWKDLPLEDQMASLLKSIGKEPVGVSPSGAEIPIPAAPAGAALPAKDYSGAQPINIWKIADPKWIPVGHPVQAGEGGPIGTFKGVSPGGTTMVDWKAPVAAAPPSFNHQFGLPGNEMVDQLLQAHAQTAKEMAEDLAFGKSQAASDLPSNKGYTLSSAAHEDFPESANDYFVHDPKGNKIGELTHVEREGGEQAYTPAHWKLSMPGAAEKNGTSLEDLMRYIPDWHQGAAKVAGAPSLSDAEIEKQLAANPGASIFDLAGVSGPSSKVKPKFSGYEPTTQFGALGAFPREVPFFSPEQALEQGYVTPLVHGTRRGSEWAVPGAEEPVDLRDIGKLGELHAQGKDALLLPDNEIGVHAGTPEQASWFTSNVLGGGYLPRTYPLVARTGRSLEMRDMGTWHLPEINQALDKLHNGDWSGLNLRPLSNPEQHIGEFPPEERAHIDTIQEMRKYLADKGYDSINYLNKVEGEGRSYIMFKPSEADPRFAVGMRSPFAAFDPSKLARPELAAGLAGAAVLPALASPFLFDEQNRPYVVNK